MIGWREWVTLPRLCQTRIKAKVDTGAKTSSLHAPELMVIEFEGETLAQFDLLPHEDSDQGRTSVTAPVVDFRTVRSSNGQAEDRPVIRTEMELGDDCFDIDLTLTSRAAMGHRLLIGRRVLEDRFWVDPARTFLLTSGGVA